MASWKDGINVVQNVSEVTLVSVDTLIAQALRAKLAAGEIAPSSRSFASSLVEGFNKYHSFTERQRPYAQKLASSEVAQASTPLAVDRSKFVDLTGLPAGWYAVEKRRYRVKRPKQGSWTGWTFLDDGSAYGASEKYGRQKPESKILQITARNADLVARDLRIILQSPPHVAAAQYGRITGSCGICGRVLEDPESVARGIGPVCASRF
jgi:hypothetical protein